MVWDSRKGRKKSGAQIAISKICCTLKSPIKTRLFIIVDSAIHNISHCKDTLCSTFWEICDGRICVGRCARPLPVKKLC
jgi:hypothetical protein